MTSYIKYRKCKYCKAVLLFRDGKNYHRVIEPARVGRCEGLDAMGIDTEKGAGKFFTTQERIGSVQAFYLEV